YQKELCADVGVRRTLAILESAIADRRHRYFGKRCLDLMIASATFIIAMPLMLMTVIALWSDLGFPILLRQTRAGLNGKPFCLYKFRTMTDDVDSNGQLLPDADRVTPLSRWIRRLSLDELPQLWNVIRGEMSLVGPRPLFMAYLDRYTPEQ